MKRIITLVLAVVLMLTITVSATAAEFVESITNKGAPQLVVIDQVDGKDVVGYIKDSNGDQLSTEYIECLIITSVSEAEDDPDIPDDAREELLEVYDELRKPGTNLSEVCPDLDDIVKNNWDPNKSANDLVVKDLFDISDLCDDIKDHLKDGAVLDLTFDLGIASGTFITAMVYVDGKWQPVVSCVNNGDGTVTVEFDKICPVAFLVPGSGVSMSTVSPTTSDASGIVLYSGILFVSLMAIVALVIYRRKVNG